VCLLPSLPAGDVVRLLEVWAAHSGSSPSRLLTEAARQLLRLVGMAVEMRGASMPGIDSDGGVNAQTAALPGHMAPYLMRGLLAICGASARASAGEQLQEAGKQLADALATCPDLAAHVGPEPLQRLRNAAPSAGTWLQTHPLLATM
jgi:hypothetical protein